ncbi:uncharacterized protein C57A10.07 [Physcomitrium patens]|uniref:DUF218 domain-containing protein n=1 Tax=Physcomitrium patens TaxID=3218 RepID=A0A2K1IEL7_PHYPA|nr:uncharacterized protein C57A10.07-like [Physcomitrium patens]PNR27720.1 hypothetical protein PHYPA_029872 [Physcomitrium patens]|eukprot:XP_024365745.1 uncharacterized protein C57A10.07-like [Physcomitrella patens]
MDGGRDSDLESGLYSRRLRKKRSLTFLQKMKMLPSIAAKRYHKLPASFVVSVSLCVSALLFVSVFMYIQAFGTQFSSARANSQLFAEHNSSYTNLRSLVMVAGHAVYTSSKCGKPEDEDSWFLEPYQKHPGQASTFVEHIKLGVEVTSQFEDSLLLFSGGETRKNAGPKSEGQSYWNVAESKDWFGHNESVRWRTLTEEFARDSFENLLFSMCRFRELTGHYPVNITVVSYDFKQRRFTDFHRRALRFPESRFTFLGVPLTPESQEAAIKGEEKVLEMFQEDPYGCKGELWKKRIFRDPFVRSVPYPTGCSELRGLFSYCGPDYYMGSLPWIS